MQDILLTNNNRITAASLVFCSLHLRLKRDVPIVQLLVAYVVNIYPVLSLITIQITILKDTDHVTKGETLSKIVMYVLGSQMFYIEGTFCLPS